MTQERKFMKYAQAHQQAVRLCWIDHRVTEVDALEAVELCTASGTAGRIMGVVAQDRRFAVMLEDLLDSF